MPTAIYIASPEGDTGKSTIALGILHRLAATVAKVGVFRPITRLGGQERDYILELLLAHTTAGLSYDECVGVGYAQHTRTRTPRSPTSSTASTGWPSSATRWSSSAATTPTSRRQAN